MAEVCAVVCGRTDDEAEDGRWAGNGNLIEGEGIFLGKGEPAVETLAA